jgi:hypothetical protein
MTTPLDDAARARLAALAEALIPPSDEMPSVADAEVARAGVDYVLSVRPDLLEPLGVALDWPDGNRPDKVLSTLRAEAPAVFAALGEIVAGAYFLDRAVQERIGYHGRAAMPVTELTERDHALLRPVVRRGPIYRGDPRDTS